MPQMMPMNWMLMTIMFIMLIISCSMIIYFMPFKLNTHSTSYNMNKYQMKLPW